MATVKTRACIALLFSSARVSFGRSIVTRQDGIVDPGIAPNCVAYDLATQSASTCAFFESQWGISHQDFIRWNPSIKADCSGIQVGHSYCVDVLTGGSSTTLTTLVPTGTTTILPSPTTPGGAAPPSPTTVAPGLPMQTPGNTQPGIASNCNAFYPVAKGDTCDSIVFKFGNFTLEDFTHWNAGVGGAKCDTMWANTFACIGIAGNSGKPPKSSPMTSIPTSTAIPAGCQVAHPAPTQPGSICECKQWYLPASGEFCFDIQTKFQITPAQFNAWNPRIGQQCENLWKDYYVCVKA
ncbi:hypothetical protein GQ53DRAFT_838731 [Thozetella sp. PMI_491]|nr:hypothetical protein GQ53DRAFT_838731 [Thozetella sp. PMI_491]